MKLILLIAMLLYLLAYTKRTSGILPDIVINEIMFDPPPDGTDYIELFNRSDTPADLSGWHLANRNAQGVIGSVKTLSKQAALMEPGAFRVITEDTVYVQKRYGRQGYSPAPGTFTQLSSMPSYPNTAGTVVLLDAANKVVDEVAYTEKWHFALINNKEGIALERIDFNKPAQDSGNWHSAATDADYGTPGYKNSQYSGYMPAPAWFRVQPRMFSPDNDGYNDYAIISYQFPEPGYVCNITLFNTAGYPVKSLVRNALCGLSGYFKWDGLDDRSNASSAGHYILLAEIFNPKGKTIKFKQLVTLARKLN